VPLEHSALNLIGRKERVHNSRAREKTGLKEARFLLRRLYNRGNSKSQNRLFEYAL